MPKITAKQILEWKKQYGDIYELSAGDKKAYIKHPDRQTLSFAMAEAQTNPLGYTEVILDNCWLGGDEALREDDAYFLGISKQLDDIIEIADVKLKKL